MGFDKTREPSFRKRPQRSSIPSALQTFVLLKIFSIQVLKEMWLLLLFAQ